MAPTPIATYQVDSPAADQTTLISPSFTPSPGEVIVVKLNTWDTANGMAAPTGGSQTYVAAPGAVAPGGFNGWVGIWVATISGSPGAMTVSSAPATAVNTRHTMVVERWANAKLAGTPASSNGTGVGSLPSLSLVTTAPGSVISWVISDAQSIDPATRAYLLSGVEDGLFDGHVGSNGVFYFAYSGTGAVTGAGSYTYGMSAPGGQTWVMAGVEILDAGASAGDWTMPDQLPSHLLYGLLAQKQAAIGEVSSTVIDTLDATLTVTDSITADTTLTKPLGVSLTETATITAAETTTKPVDASLTATATITAAENTTKPVDASLTATATITAAVTITKPIDVAATTTATITAAGTTTKPVDASPTITATITPSAATTKPVDASLTETATITAASTSTKPVDASLTATATITAAETTTKPVDASLTETATITATIQTGVGAALTETATITADTTLAKPVDASLTETATITATGATSKPIDAALTETATITAASTLSKPVAASLTVAATITATVTVQSAGAAQPGRWGMIHI